MPVTTIVTGSFTADHQKPYGVRRHGHDWHVRVSFEATGHKDEPQRWLDETLAVFDHGFLDEHLEDPSNEGVAKWLGEHLHATRVYVWRYDKGREFGAEWTA